MNYGQNISGIHASGIAQTKGNAKAFKPLHSKELLQDLLTTLLEYPEIPTKLGYLTTDNKLTKLATDTLLLGLEINYDKCFGGTPRWQLKWYD